MAQLDCFLCKEEKIELINLVFSLNLLLVPDLSYDSEHYSIIKDIDEYKNYVYKNELFFIVNSKIEKESLVHSKKMEGVSFLFVSGMEYLL